jgi:hypothetical protein
MLANLMTFAHFSISLAIRRPKSAGEPGMMVPPRSASFGREADHEAHRLVWVGLRQRETRGDGQRGGSGSES